VNHLKEYFFGLCCVCAVNAMAQLTKSGPLLPPKYVDGVLVVVGNKVILRSELEENKKQMELDGRFLDPQTIECATLEQLIVNKLMLHQAELDSLPVSEEELEFTIENRLRYFKSRIGSTDQLEKYLGKPIASWKEEIRPMMREELLTQAMRNSILRNVKISPQEVKAFYDSIPMDSLPIIPTEVEVAQLLVIPAVSLESKEFAREQLEAVRKRILRGESFEKLARAYSMDPGSKAQGGLLPEFGRGEMMPEFERMAFKLKPDTLSPIFETDFGYHILKVSKRRGEKVVASHILIRAENTTEDISRALYRIDSAYNLVVENKIQWCDAVKKYATAGDRFMPYDKGTCGFYQDMQTGMQKMQFEALPPDVRKIAEKMKPGEVSSPALINSEDGRPVYRLIYLSKITPPHTANLVQDYSKIQMQADNKKRYETLQKWVIAHRKVNYIRFKGKSLECENLKSWENE